MAVYVGGHQLQPGHGNALRYGRNTASCSHRSSLKQNYHSTRHVPQPRRSLVLLNVAAPYNNRSLTMRHEPQVVTRRSDSEEAKLNEYGVATRISLISSPDQFDKVLADNPSKLIVLMCKAKSCRPCKMFSRKYTRIADKHEDSVFLDVYGDENMETRKMMMDMKVKATPTFRIYRGSELLKVITGANEKKVSDAIVTFLQPGETGYGSLPVEPESEGDH